jgi:hypothetical protein
MNLVDTQEHLDWLVDRALKLYARWPGVGEIRALYCSRHRPKDGATTYSEVYESGYPSERSPAPLPLPPGHASTADAEFERELRTAAKLKKMPVRVK